MILETDAGGGAGVLVVSGRRRERIVDRAGDDAVTPVVRRRRPMTRGHVMPPREGFVHDLPSDRATGEHEHLHNVTVAPSGTLTSTCSRPASAKARVRLARFWE